MRVFNWNLVVIFFYIWYPFFKLKFNFLCIYKNHLKTVVARGRLRFDDDPMTLLVETFFMN
ncbi:hypothetical protein HanPI659440_Chr03g0138061 [Helianthus annuus]|nr:hypothetical protein HanPI659440_Chr03g0138061 [Helianthus annuus]